MPIARIRTLDPEAISFLAAGLAASGFQLKFSAPNDIDPDDADLEIIVTRMDSATALQQARIQAEEMGVDVTIMPGALDTFVPVPSSEAVPDPVLDKVSALEHTSATPESVPGHPAPWTTPYHAEVSNEFVSTRASSPDETQALEPTHASAGDVIASGLKRGAESLAAFTQSSATRFAEWNRRHAEARAERRAQREREAKLQRENRERLAREDEQRRLLEFPNTLPPATASISGESLSSKLRLASTHSSSRRISRRDQNYRRAAITAAALLLALILGWGVIGMRGPANPIGGSTLTNVQQQTPFGAASVSAPVQAPAPNLRPAAASQSSAVTPSHKPVETRHARISTHRHRASRRSSDDDGEVVIRHFGTKSVAQQTKAKTRDGVKIITEE